MESPVESDGQLTMAPSMYDVENPVGALRILRKKAYKPRQLSQDIRHSNHSIKSRCPIGCTPFRNKCGDLTCAEL